MFCKYEQVAAHTGHGHRRGVAYEAEVYEHAITGPVKCSAPVFFGRHRDRERGDTWLFIEALDGKSIANITDDSLSFFPRRPDGSDAFTEISPRVRRSSPTSNATMPATIAGSWTG